MLNESLNALPPTRDEFAIESIFYGFRRSALLVTLFEEEIARHEEKLTYLESRWQMLFGTTNPKERYFGHSLILERAIRREKDHLTWLHEAYKSFYPVKSKIRRLQSVTVAISFFFINRILS